jgi:CSLREA domain-containing protein
LEDRVKAFVSLLLAVCCLLAVPVTASAVVTYTVDSTADEADAVPGTGGCLTVGLKCTLRAAIEESNFSAGVRDEIKFSAAFDGQPADTIVPATALPAIEDPVSILGGDCFGEDGPDAPCAGIKGPSGAAALTVDDADGVVIEGLAITAAQFGIDVVGGSEGFVARNDWIGLTLSAAKEANLIGIFLDPGSDGATIGGLAASERNVIAGNEGDGLYLNGASDATILGNYFGVNPPGPVGLPGGSQQMANGKDIEITDSTSGGGVNAEDNEVGATIEGSALTNPACDGGCNVISGANAAGIDLNGDGAGQNEAPASGPTSIHGNFIGVGASGAGTVANGSYGVLAGHADNVTVGEFP